MHPYLTDNLKYSTYAAGITLAAGLIGVLLIFAVCIVTTAGEAGWTSMSQDTLLTTLGLTIIAIVVILFIFIAFFAFILIGYFIWALITKKSSPPVLYSLLGTLLTISVSFILSLGACFGGLFISNTLYN